MAYENIRFSKANLSVYNGYFFMIDDSLDVLVVKTDDGTQSFTYPLDTEVMSVNSLEYDGYNLWTLEQTATNSIRIRRWAVINYVCKLIDSFDYVESGDNKFQSAAFAVERYQVSLSDTIVAGESYLTIKDSASGAVCSKIRAGLTVAIGPNAAGQTEEFGVLDAGVDYLIIGGTLANTYTEDTPVRFYTDFWLFNNFNGTISTTGALYRLSAYDVSIVSKYAGNEYKNVASACFYGVPNFVFNPGSSTTEPRDYAVCYVKSTNLIFLDAETLAISPTALGSLVMDNIESNLSVIIPVYDIAMCGSNIYRLQLKATYYGTTSTFGSSTYNYQLSTFNKLITSISLSADPAILPADAVATSTITAIVKDQFNLPVASKPVTFTDDDTYGQIILTGVSTDSDGVAITTYRAGNEAREVRITATALQG